MTLRRHLRVLEAHSGVQLTQGNHQWRICQKAIRVNPKGNFQILDKNGKNNRNVENVDKIIFVKAK